MFPVTFSRINSKSSYPPSSPSFRSSGYPKGVTSDTFSPRFGAAIADDSQARAREHIKKLWRSEDPKERVLTAGFAIDNITNPQDLQKILKGLARAKDEALQVGLLFSLFPPFGNAVEIAARLSRIDYELKEKLTMELLAAWQNSDVNKLNLLRAVQTTIEISKNNDLNKIRELVLLQFANDKSPVMRKVALESFYLLEMEGFVDPIGVQNAIRELKNDPDPEVASFARTLFKTY
jgi:hypothetical protein